MSCLDEFHGYLFGQCPAEQAMALPRIFSASYAGLTRVSRRNKGIVMKCSFGKLPNVQIIVLDPAIPDAQIILGLDPGTGACRLHV
jgi:hypothetical protein